MSIAAGTTIGTVVLAMALLGATRLAPDLVMVGAVTLLLALGILQPGEAVAGLANEGVLTIGVLFVVAAGLRDTGAMALAARFALGRPVTVAGAQARMMFPVAAASAFLNNTPLVAMMLPVVDDWARRLRLSSSKLLLPLSYATILGGLCTLIGTSTNLVIAGLVSAHGSMELRLFDPAWIGVPCCLAGLSYILIATPWLLPDRKPVLGEPDDARNYTVEMLVEPGSGLVGQTIEQAGLRHLPGLYLVEIGREGAVLAAVPPHEKLRSDDRLVFVGIVESVVDLTKLRGLKPATDQVFKLGAPRSHRCLIEAVVSNTCPLVGMTIREGRFRTAYNAAVIAVARNGERIHKKIGDIVLEPGDTLLLEAHPTFVDRQRNSRDFFLVSRVEGSTPPRHDRAWAALAILLAMVVSAGVGLVSMFTAALLASALMILTRCVRPSEARASVDWTVLVVIAASFGLGQAMEKTGAARAIAETLIGLAGSNPWVALAVVYAVTMLFTEVMSHIAAAVVVFPIAQAAATALGVNFQPFVMAMMMAASCGFATPIGYQTNLMVYGPGGYHFRDYVRFGGPLNLVVMAVTLALAPLVWPF